MGRYPYHPSTRTYEDYYKEQAGKGMNVFVGRRHMRGKGLGSFLSGIGRANVPLLNSSGKALSKQGVNLGMQVASGVKRSKF